MSYLKSFVFTTILLVFNCLNAQQTAVFDNDFLNYQKGLSLYNAKQYLSAQHMFQKVQDEARTQVLLAESAYYIANCAVRLNQSNAEQLVMNFVEQYPTSTKRNTAFLDIGNYYFDTKKYAYAKKWYDKVDEFNLNFSDKENFNFNYGYTNFTIGNKKDAERYLQRVTTSKTYGAQAKYYIGYMAYQGDDYNTANTYFEQVSDNEKYKEKLSYYQADLNFKLGKFQEAIDLAKQQLSKSNPEEVSELSKIIGESYFNLEQYNEALPYLKAYKGKKEKWNNTDFYQLGYTYYKQNDFENAIAEFNKIVDGKDAVSQNAYYHLGESYIKLNKKTEALNAFKNASEMSFDNKIKEDSWLNYAKLSYEIGNPYQSVPQVLNNYLEAYPNTGYKDDIETLLIDSYITSKNYREALYLLESKRRPKNKEALQKVAFYLGLELYNDNKYADALSMFNKSVSEPANQYILARSLFWKAETEFYLNNFQESLISFKQFQQHADANATPEYGELNYSLAYVYFKVKNYDQAASYFDDFASKNPQNTSQLNDAFLRLGDSYFMASNYRQAINAYEKANKIGSIEKDYAAFQIAMSQGFSGNTNQKISGLKSFISSYPSSGLRDDAMFELANTLVKTNQTNDALKLYDQLNLEYKNSVFVPRSLLRQGLVYYNNNNTGKALEKFKKVAGDYPNTEEANQAVATARLIYIDIGQVEQYAQWVKTLDFIEVSDAELDNTSYLAAEKQYLDGNSKSAIKQFNGYINSFPNGLHSLKAHFYLAQLYYADNLFENAQPHYSYVLEQSANEYSEQAMVKLSEIYLNAGNWNDAIQVLERLENTASYAQNKVFAQSNLMNAYYQIKQFDKALNYAELVLSTTTDNKIKNDAQIIVARTSLELGKTEKARQAYVQLEKSASGALMAEALYYNAYFKNSDGQFEASNTLVQRLAKDYSSYKYFSAKGLIVMAKNYSALNDNFQATYILESVLKNFTQFEDVMAEAQEALNSIKEAAAKTNASVETNND
jgi:TolA-binding protein